MFPFVGAENTGYSLSEWDRARCGLALRYFGLTLLALAVGSATLTFDWIIAHRVESNLVGEFAGAVLYPSDVLLGSGLSIWFIGW